uniref:Amidase n=1 Tax=Pseudomonas putida TaxID=303 RepID=AMID_PSEPU|nr:RecName: Full=Amidase [Pseudomonas putida]AAC18422.1 amidase [Pseudomonas putida]
MSSLTRLTLAQVAQKLKAREVSAVEVLDACLTQVRSTEKQISAYVCVLEDQARAAAHATDADIRGRWKGPLHGVPVAVKDLYDIAGVPTTASSPAHELDAQQDPARVRRLQDAGAVILGKTHTHEFAYGRITPKSRNPRDPGRTPGGSSGGSAATVAACCVYLATGTDTGGSVRIPSSMCNTVGLKQPTVGRVHGAGVSSLSWSLDHPGPITRTVEDTALMLQVMAGFDPADPRSLDEPVPSYAEGLGQGVKGLRWGVPKNYFFDRVDPEVESAVRAAIDQLKELGAELVEVEVPMAEQIIPVKFGIMLPEASAYHRTMLRESPELYTADVRILLELGDLVTATDYLQAQRVRTLMQRAVAEMYQRIDVLIAPTLPIPAARSGEEVHTWPDGTVEALVMAYTRFTSFGNVTGLPTLNLPCGFSKDGLRSACRSGRPLDEKTLLRAGLAYEKATTWHQRHPELIGAG